ncbi:hypothetical protein JOF36_003850 [Pseudonocardia parietis]|uniref:C-type lectin domain-containing protein n=1 Tax=Pseudonocardia parietis TaxID=570936 RepID=A0ABS4VXF3_9PSEU|nr:hypothetical protein [Pseudonocardia parietis]
MHPTLTRPARTPQGRRSPTAERFRTPASAAGNSASHGPSSRWGVRHDRRPPGGFGQRSSRWGGAEVPAGPAYRQSPCEDECRSASHAHGPDRPPRARRAATATRPAGTGHAAGTGCRGRSGRTGDLPCRPGKRCRARVRSRGSAPSCASRPCFSFRGVRPRRLPAGRIRGGRPVARIPSPARTTGPVVLALVPWTSPIAVSTAVATALHRETALTISCGPGPDRHRAWAGFLRPRSTSGTWWWHGCTGRSSTRWRPTDAGGRGCGCTPWSCATCSRASWLICPAVLSCS